MKRIVTILTGALLTAVSALGGDVVTVSGEATYYDNGTHSKIECMRLAAEEARVNALAREFGTIVAQDILETERVSDNRDHSDFLSLSSTEVRGEWIADESEPEYEISADKEGNYVVKCRVRGKASPISNEATAFDAMVLRNAPDRKAADNHLRDGDAMYLYFNGSADGYISAFLEDESGSVYQLLPYIADNDSRMPVKRNREYIFFSPEKADPDMRARVDEFYVTAPDHTEYNRLYVVYSPNYFSRPVMSASGGGIPSMSRQDFTKWISKTRRNDERMGVKAMNIEIVPRN